MTFEIQVVGPGDRQLVRDVYGALRENFAPEELDPEEEFLENLEPFNPLNGRGLGIQLGLKCWEVANQMRVAADSEVNVPIRAIFVEVHRPELKDQQSNSMDPLERVSKLQHMGVRILEDFDYWMPPLSEDGIFERYFLGCVTTPKSPVNDDGEPIVYVHTVKAFVRDFFEMQLGPHWDETLDAGSGRAACDASKVSEALTFYKGMIQSLENRRETHGGVKYIRLVKLNLRQYVVPVHVPTRPVGRSNDKKQLTTTTDPSSAPVKDTQSKHVVVVGAGLAGLACAQRLVQSSLYHEGRLRVTVLEGRSRIGGRVHTSRSHAVRIDLGAMWFHGLAGNEAYELLPDEDWKLFETDDLSVSLYSGAGKKIPTDAVLTAGLKADQIMEAFAAHCQENPHVADHANIQHELDKFFLRHPEFRFDSETEQIVMGYTLSSQESLENAALRDLSLRNLADEDHELMGGDQVVMDGASTVANALCKGIEVSLRSTVTAVQVTGPQRARVHFHTSTSSLGDPSTAQRSQAGPSVIDADFVVVTTPVALLQSPMARPRSAPTNAACITFEPPLPQRKQQAIDRIGAGLFNKVVLHFDRAFWIDDLHSHYIGFNLPVNDDGTLRAVPYVPERLHRPRENIWFVNFMPSHEAPVLVAMITGDLSRRLEAKSNDQVVQHVLNVLRIMYGNATVLKPLHTMVTSWGRDPYANMSYSFCKRGSSPADIEEYASPCFGSTVLFAGEGTSTTRFGYMDGAIQTGRREADRLIDLLLPGTSTRAEDDDDDDDDDDARQVGTARCRL